MRSKFFAWAMCVGLLVSSAGLVSAAKPTGSKIRTDNPEVNAKIDSGEITVQVYEPPSESKKQQITEKLKGLGYSDEELNATPWALKQFYASTERSPHKAARSTMVERSPEAESAELGTMALNPNWMDWSHWNMSVGTASKNRFAIYGDFNWKSLPNFKLEDKIGWAWESDGGHTWAPESVQVHAYHYACTSGGTCKEFLMSNTTAVDNGNFGVGVEYDLIFGWTDGGPITYSTQDIYGTAMTIISRPKAGTPATPHQAVYDVEYAHKQGTCQFSLTFTRGPLAVGISCSTTHDKTDTMNGSFTYYP